MSSLPSPQHRSLNSQFEKISFARQTILEEAAALKRLSDQLPARFDDVIELILAGTGSLIVCGIGKAGWIGQKLSATLASTGTRSQFLHPAEAMHGDLGRIAPNDIILMISNSGETSELNQLLPTLDRMGNPLIALTASADSTLGRAADWVLDFGQVREACPLGLAPTSSAIVMMSLGDAMAMVLAQCRGFRESDFGRFHPGGKLGLKLARVEEVMRPLGECRVASDQDQVREIYIRFAGPQRRSGALMLVDEAGRFCGIFTDSDLARLLEQKRDSDFDRPIMEVMTKQPITAVQGTEVKAAVELMAGRNLSELPIIDRQGKPIGMIDITDVISLLPKKSAAPQVPI